MEGHKEPWAEELPGRRPVPVLPSAVAMALARSVRSLNSVLFPPEWQGKAAEETRRGDTHEALAQGDTPPLPNPWPF